jgi:hypothetical protein
MCERENAFFKLHKEEFREKYPDQNVILVGEEIIGVYKDLGEATIYAMTKYKPGEFTIKFVYKNPQEEIHRFYNRVYV